MISIFANDTLGPTIIEIGIIENKTKKYLLIKSSTHIYLAIY